MYKLSKLVVKPKLNWLKNHLFILLFIKKFIDRITIRYQMNCILNLYF